MYRLLGENVVLLHMDQDPRPEGKTARRSILDISPPDNRCIRERTQARYGKHDLSRGRKRLSLLENFDLGMACSEGLLHGLKQGLARRKGDGPGETYRSKWARGRESVGGSHAAQLSRRNQPLHARHR